MAMNSEGDYSGPDARNRALAEFFKKDKNKIPYAIPIAERIVSLDDGRPTIPAYIEKLFKKLDKVITPEGDSDE